jgi:uracil-DNA glycosylase
VVTPLRFATTLPEAVPKAWAKLLGSHTVNLLRSIGEHLDARAHTEQIVPAAHHIFRALTLDPDNVSVIIIGQDPYPTPGHAMGLSFSVPEGVWPLPPTLKNILRELSDDLGITHPPHGNLTSWHRQGVLLLNRHLTTAARQPGAHHRIGWAEFTTRVVETLVDRDPRRVAVLWGKEAQSVSPLLGSLPTITSAHPSPLSAHRGFFGSTPFSLANRYLESLGRRPIDWSLDQVTGCQPG